jgi:Arc/MetJ-type ribon-helix-helix transcriptional regulator
MPMTKIAVTVDKEVAREIDRLVALGRFSNRSKAIQQALKEMLRDTKKMMLAAECVKLDPKEEKALAEEFIGSESWPEY